MEVNTENSSSTDLFHEVLDSLKDSVRRSGQCLRLPDRLSQSKPWPCAASRAILNVECTSALGIRTFSCRHDSFNGRAGRLHENIQVIVDHETPVGWEHG